VLDALEALGLDDCLQDAVAQALEGTRLVAAAPLRVALRTAGVPARIAARVEDRLVRTGLPTPFSRSCRAAVCALSCVGPSLVPVLRCALWLHVGGAARAHPRPSA
jgi:hypothetical protein